MKYFIFILVACFTGYDILVQTAPGVLTHQMMSALHIGASGLGILSGIYFYTYLIMQIPAGLLYDRFTMRYVISLPLVITVAGMALFASMDSVLAGCAARLLIGFGTAFAFISATRVAADIFDKKTFPILVGFIYVLASLGGLFAQVPLVSLTHAFGWRGALWVLAVAGIVLLVLIWAFVRYEEAKTFRKHRVYDEPVGQSLAKVVRCPQSWWIGVVSLCTWGPMAVFASLWGVPFLMRTYAMPKHDAALWMSILWIGFAIAAPTIGWVSNVMRSRRWPLVMLSLLGFVASACLLFGLPHHHSMAIVCMILFGVACSAQPLSYTLIKENHAHHNTATAVSFNNMAAILAGALFQPISGWLIDLGWHGKVVQGTPVYAIANYQHGLVVVPIMFLVSLIVSLLWVKETFKG